MGASAAAVGAALNALSLSAWVLYRNDVHALIDVMSEPGVEEALSWLGLLALAGVLVAIVLDRGTRPSSNSPGRSVVDEGAHSARR